MSQSVHIDVLEARAREHGVLVPDGIFAPLLLRGKDALDLIHRLSTNDLRMCKEGAPTGTIFTTEKGRVIDRAEVVVLGEHVWLVCHAGALARVREWIERFIITEEVEVAELSPAMKVRSLVTGKSDPTPILSRDSHGMAPIPEWLSRFGPFAMFRSIVGSSGDAEVAPADRSEGVTVLTDAEFQALRIAHGIPAFPQELNEGRNPLECGLRGDISFSKGCYVGQEVIARLDAYEKVQRELVVLAVSAGDTIIADGAEIVRGSASVGTVTSSGGIMSAPTGETMAMGFLERSSALHSIPLAIRTASGPRPARVLGLAGTMRSTGSTPA